MESSLERIIPDLASSDEGTGRKTLELHIERYRFAGKYLKQGTAADIACGVGYGSHILATDYGEKIRQIYAVDNNSESIAFATRRYAHPKITYVQSDALAFRIRQKLDNIVSLETIEHLENPLLFIQHMVSLLCTGGRFVASVPVTPSMDANPYHFHDFTTTAFKKMFINAGLKEIISFTQKQPYNPFSLFKKLEYRNQKLRKNLLSHYLRHPQKFLLRLQSLFKDGFCNKYLIVVFEKQ